MSSLEHAKPEAVRRLIRGGEWKKPTVGLAQGYVQANILILPKEKAYDFMLFCLRNPKPCTLLEVLDAGSPMPKITCSNSDIRYDLNKYRIYKQGRLECEVDHIADYWREDFVSFILGCSFTFENALIKSGVEMRHVQENKRVPMYTTNIKCTSANDLDTNMVVSMRPIPIGKLVKTIQITARYPSMHGTPVHIGAPEQIGISDITKPDFGDHVNICSNEVPVFWACGGTVFNLIEKLDCNIAITHAPSHMYILDLKDDDFMAF